MYLYSKKMLLNTDGGGGGDISEWQHTEFGDGREALQEYVGSRTDVVVPKVYQGRTTVLNGYSEYPGYTWRSPFYRNRGSLTSVDLREVPAFGNATANSLAAYFSGCANLREVTNINQNITNMYNTFGGCLSFNQNVQIPNSVTTMVGTFSNCRNLNQNIQIPDGVLYASSIFYDCSNLNQNIRLPDTVQSMLFSFRNCRRLNQEIHVPNSVINMYFAFENCRGLRQIIFLPQGVQNIAGVFANCTAYPFAPNIPNSVIRMGSAFENCRAIGGGILPSYITIPNKVESISSAFMSCPGLFGNINVLSPKITEAQSFVYNSATSDKVINITIPYKNIDGTFSATYNAFNAAGYKPGTGVGNATIDNVVMWDFIAADYPTYTTNGAYWILQKWNGKRSNNPTNVVVPGSILGYPTAVTNACFAANASITSIDLNGAAINNSALLFNRCTGLTKAANIKVPSGATSTRSMFDGATGLTIATSGSMPASPTYTGAVDMPNTVTNVTYMYNSCKALKNFYINSFGVTEIGGLVRYCNTQPINVYLKSPNITSITNWHQSPNTSFRKNIYIYFKYANGVTTKTFNVFKAALYMGTTGNTSMANPSYNSTSNYYVYNLGACPV